MTYYHLTNRDGKFCGTKALTGAMADRLASNGWQVIPTESPDQVRAFQRRTAR